MSAISVLPRMILLAVMALCVSAVIGCSAGPSGPKTAKVKPGPMPEGAKWHGVFFSPLYGGLHIVSKGSTVEGRWERPRKDRWGEIEGEADGNLLRFKWKEHEIGLVGPKAMKHGRGYFVYTRSGGEYSQDSLEGEVGRGEDEVGTPWVAIKQKNEDPKPDSIGGMGARHIGGGDWDTKNVEPGDPEKPVDPPKDEIPEL